MSQEPLEELLQRLRGGDRQAAAALFTSYEPYLRMIVRRSLSPLLRTQLESVDLVQSVWVQVLERLDRADWEFSCAEQLRAFLVKAARNRLIDHARRMKSSRQREQIVAAAPERRDAQQPRPSEMVRARELWDQMLELCPPQHRSILHYREQGLGLDEIATRTGLHPSSVRRILYQLAGRLALQGEGDGGQPLESTPK